MDQKAAAVAAHVGKHGSVHRHDAEEICIENALICSSVQVGNAFIGLMSPYSTEL